MTESLLSPLFSFFIIFQVEFSATRPENLPMRVISLLIFSHFSCPFQHANFDPRLSVSNETSLWTRAEIKFKREIGITFEKLDKKIRNYHQNRYCTAAAADISQNLDFWIFSSTSHIWKKKSTALHWRKENYSVSLTLNISHEYNSLLISIIGWNSFNSSSSNNDEFVSYLH